MPSSGSSIISIQSADKGQACLNAMTIDVEDYFQVGVFQDRIAREEWSRFELRVGRNLERCLTVLQDFDTRATFFVLGWVAERIPGEIKRLQDEGHEVASHGFHHQPIWTMKPEAFRDDVRRAQETLGGILGEKPTTYRAPCFSVTARTLWALEILHDEGIRVDSSIFPVQHPEYGIPGAPEDIHRIKLSHGETLLEFPMTVGRLLGRKLAFCGGGWFRLFPYFLSRRGLRKSLSRRPFVFYLHPWELDPEQPRLHDRAGPLGRFRHYVNLERNEAKFRRLLEDFSFGTLGQVCDQWVRSCGELAVVDYLASR